MRCWMVFGDLVSSICVFDWVCEPMCLIFDWLLVRNKPIGYRTFCNRMTLTGGVDGRVKPGIEIETVAYGEWGKHLWGVRPVPTSGPRFENLHRSRT